MVVVLELTQRSQVQILPPLPFAQVRGLFRSGIIALSRNPERQKIAREFGATDIIEARGEEANQAVLDLTGSIGADAALECVGTEQSIATAGAIARPGSTIGIVGVPHGQVPFTQTFVRNVGWRGGPAPPDLHARTAR